MRWINFFQKTKCKVLEFHEKFQKYRREWWENNHGKPELTKTKSRELNLKVWQQLSSSERRSHTSSTLNSKNTTGLDTAKRSKALRRIRSGACPFARRRLPMGMFPPPFTLLRRDAATMKCGWGACLEISPFNRAGERETDRIDSWDDSIRNVFVG